MGRRGLRGLKTRAGWESCISRGGPDWKVEAYRPEEEVPVLQ